MCHKSGHQPGPDGKVRLADLPLGWQMLVEPVGDTTAESIRKLLEV